MPYLQNAQKSFKTLACVDVLGNFLKGGAIVELGGRNIKLTCKQNRYLAASISVSNRPR